VREALLVLERRGVVRFERNRRVRVLETTAHDLEEVFALRLLLETGRLLLAQESAPVAGLPWADALDG
jgi:DNA-binding GntR family transcriptional regulator